MLVDHAVVLDVHDMGAGDPRRGPRLPLEPRQQGGVVGHTLGADELDRHLHVEPEVLGDPDTPHAALPQRPEQTELARNDCAAFELHHLGVSLLHPVGAAPSRCGRARRPRP